MFGSKGGPLTIVAFIETPHVITGVANTIPIRIFRIKAIEIEHKC